MPSWSGRENDVCKGLWDCRSPVVPGEGKVRKGHVLMALPHSRAGRHLIVSPVGAIDSGTEVLFLRQKIGTDSSGLQVELHVGG